jgi:dTDP-4-amino-4,6-dideoxygalactose transaminase
MADSKNPIYVTKTFLPPKEEFDEYVARIWQTNQLTNNGPLSAEFEEGVSNYLGLDRDNLRLVTNGTLALQLALKSLNITEGEVITTPFSYVATTSAILWERCVPVFVDIDPGTLNIDPSKIEDAITPKTKAILPVHVFGNPCDVDAIQEVADRHNLKVIYDAAHAFGVKYHGKSLFAHGDISTGSFHATKLFHTIEGGLIYAKDLEVIEKVELLKRFGHNGDEHLQLGINAKASEFSAAMGLVSLKHIDAIIADRKRAHELYDKHLDGKFKKQKITSGTTYNYSYYPIIFDSEEDLLEARKKLEEHAIFPRRYFYPSLNTLAYLDEKYECPISEDISRRIMCLPLYFRIEEEDIERICETLTS